MQSAAAVVEKDALQDVGSVSDKMAAELCNLGGNLSKVGAAERLYLAGFTQSDIVENIDEAIEKATALIHDGARCGDVTAKGLRR